MPGFVPGTRVFVRIYRKKDVVGRNIWREDALRAFVRP
jgi:hypothetical protein